MSSSSSSRVVIRVGSILNTDKEYIVNFCDSRSAFPKPGLCRDVFETYPNANCYSERLDPTRNSSDPLGTIIQRQSIKAAAKLSDEEKKEQSTNKIRSILHFIIQKGQSDADQEANDTSENRFQWFVQCTQQLKQIVKQYDTFAFPYRLASLWKDKYWPKYEQVLQQLNKELQEQTNTDTTMIFLYKQTVPSKFNARLQGKPNARQKTITQMVENNK